MIIEGITENDIKKIFNNKKNKELYLERLFRACDIHSGISRNNSEIDQQIMDTWSYERSKDIIRELFVSLPKYLEQRELDDKIDAAIEEWKALGLGDFEWPFAAMSFDQHVHALNRSRDYSEQEKDIILSKEIIKFRRIKHINSLRNDYIEHLIFQNPNVIPTLGNRRGVDFYINGQPYDQKVAKSVGKAFMERYGENYRDIALLHPERVAECLYENQDEERFGDEPRLLIVYLDSDVDSHSIANQLSSINFDEPFEITFQYKHSNNVILSHQTKCFVILLHN